MIDRQMGLILTGVGLASGALGFIAGVMITKDRAYSEYEASLQAHKNALDKAAELRGDRPEESEEDLQATPRVAVQGTLDVVHHDPENTSYAPSDTNPYHTAVVGVAEPVIVHTNQGPNEYGIEYIEEEDFLDAEDGFDKVTCSMVMMPEGAQFYVGGELMHDPHEILGPSIEADFRAYVPSGVLHPTLYVRNHKRAIDFELTPEHP